MKPQRCCRNTAVAAMVQNSGLFSRSVPSDSSDMGQHLESIPQGSMLGHVAATASSRLGSSSIFNLANSQVPRLAEPKALATTKSFKTKKGKPFTLLATYAGYFFLVFLLHLSTHALTTGTLLFVWHHLSALFRATYAYSTNPSVHNGCPAESFPAGLLPAKKKINNCQRSISLLNVKENSKVPTDQRRSIDGCKNNIFQHPTLFGSKSTHKPWIPTRKPLRKTREKIPDSGEPKKQTKKCWSTTLITASAPHCDS